jgi:hypothetical protein
VSGKHNLGIWFRKRYSKTIGGKEAYVYGNKMIAFDIDSPTGEYTQDVKDSLRILMKVVIQLGFKPFCYFSGNKGAHLEVFFDEAIDGKKLNMLNVIIQTKHRDFGGAYIDCIYPCNKAYRVFGCLHWKTG